MDLGFERGDALFKKEAFARWCAGLLLLFVLQHSLSADETESPEGTKPVWGELEMASIVLEPPDDRNFLTAPMRERIVWHFPERSKEAVLEVLKEFGLDPSEISQLDVNGEWVGGPSISVFPPLDLVWRLKKQKRKALYGHLWNRGIGGLSFNIEGGDYSMLEQSEMSQELLGHIKELSFFRGETLVFSDIKLFAQTWPDEAELRTMMKTLWRTQALMVKVKVDAETDVKALSEYWTIQGQTNTILPILRSLQATEGVQWIDVTHLLPPFAKKYVNTFQKPGDNAFGRPPDCFSSVINFSRTSQLRRVLDMNDVSYYLGHDYVRVEPPYRFGDAIVVMNPKTRAFVHAYTHIAGDIVFTKNGLSSVSPWILMREEAMMSRYSDVKTVKLGYRLKATP